MPHASPSRDEILVELHVFLPRSRAEASITVDADRATVTPIPGKLAIQSDGFTLHVPLALVQRLSQTCGWGPA